MYEAIIQKNQDDALIILPNHSKGLFAERSCICIQEEMLGPIYPWN